MSNESEIKEPAAWWTEAERKRCFDHLIKQGPFTDWLGRSYYRMTSLPEHNIYGQRFSWREYAPTSNGSR